MIDAAKRYGFALLVSGSAVGAARLLDPLLAPHLSPPYFIAVLLATVYGGAGPGLLTTALSTFAIAYFDLGEAGEFHLGADDLLRLGAFTVAAVVISSISAARKQAEQKLQVTLEQLAAADAAKDQFLASISHELRTPLTSILGWIRILRGGELDTETTRIAIESIEQSALTQSMLVADMLDSSRIAMGKVELTLAPVSLDALLKEVVTMCRPAAEHEGVSLTLHSDGPAILVADRDRLKQVYWNLLSNAIKFTDRDGLVSVNLRTRGGQVEVEVRDSGVGIDPELLPFIFERFRQGEGAVKKGGLGIGLAIARHMVELHHGQIQARSEGRGRGTAFIVTLPLPVVSGESDQREGSKRE